MDFLKGPLGSHRNYIQHIVFENYHEYRRLCDSNREGGKDSTPDKYKECRRFLSVIESMNNILDYFFFEHETEIQKKLKDFKRAVWNRYPELEELANLANAYKHCIRVDNWSNQKNKNQPWAKDLQRPQLNVDIKISSDSTNLSVGYDFPWPISENENVLIKAFKFWLAFVQDDGCDLKNV